MTGQPGGDQTPPEGQPLPRWKRAALRVLLAGAAAACLAGMLTTRSGWLLGLYAAVALWCGLLDRAYARERDRD